MSDEVINYQHDGVSEMYADEPSKIFKNTGPDRAFVVAVAKQVGAGEVNMFFPFKKEDTVGAFLIQMTEGQKEEFERLTGYRLRKQSRMQLN